MSARFVRRVLLAAVLLAPILGTELAIRSLVSTYRLPVADAHRPDFEITWANLERERTADVLVLGDSVAQQGIEPAMLERLVGAELGRDVTVFNAASPGGGIGVNAAVVEQLARQDRLPRVLIVGFATGTVSTDITFREIFSRTVMGRMFTGCNVPMPIGDLLDCKLSDTSFLWRWRGRLPDVLDAVQRPLARTDDSNALHLRSDGFREGRGRPVKAIERQLERSDLSKRRVQLAPEVRASWRWLVSVARANGASIIPVAIPDTPTMATRMERVQPGREDLYWSSIATLAADVDVPFVEVRRFGDWWGDGMARNFNHLSHAGAIAFTEQLWEMQTFRERLLDGLGPGTQ